MHRGAARAPGTARCRVQVGSDAGRRLYDEGVELRQLEAFVAVATELHFGRAAEKLSIGQPTLSDMMRRLEREMGTALLTRSTRHVALTAAGSDLLDRAKTILNEVAIAGAAVQRIAQGEAGTVRLGITPLAAPILVKHLQKVLHSQAPDVEVIVTRMWLFHLQEALIEGSVDVAITCGIVADPPHAVSEVICAEPLLASVRPDHRLAQLPQIDLTDLAHETMGIQSHFLFPAWVSAQRQALEAARVSPHTVELEDNHVSAAAWPAQAEVDWILTTGSIADDGMAAVVRPVTRPRFVPYTLQWIPDRAPTEAVNRFVGMARDDPAAVPPGWAKSGDPSTDGTSPR
ncbi:LysR family transcriptional regulator [Mycolicibacterium sp. J2]|nr:LysR family transcriptional regulator [Mycolicibacterium sp. J2]